MQRVFRIREHGKVQEVGRRTMATVPETESLESKVALIHALIPLGLKAVAEALEAEVVALACDVPEHRPKRGDIVKLVDHHIAPDGTEGYSIEVFNAVGGTLAVIVVPASALEALRQDEVLCARSL